MADVVFDSETLYMYDHIIIMCQFTLHVHILDEHNLYTVLIYPTYS